MFERPPELSNAFAKKNNNICKNKTDISRHLVVVQTESFEHKVHLIR